MKLKVLVLVRGSRPTRLRGAMATEKLTRAHGKWRSRAQLKQAEGIGRQHFMDLVEVKVVEMVGWAYWP